MDKKKGVGNASGILVTMVMVSSLVGVVGCDEKDKQLIARELNQAAHSQQQDQLPRSDPKMVPGWVLRGCKANLDSIEACNAVDWDAKDDYETLVMSCQAAVVRDLSDDISGTMAADALKEWERLGAGKKAPKASAVMRFKSGLIYTMSGIVQGLEYETPWAGSIPGIADGKKLLHCKGSIKNGKGKIRDAVSLAAAEAGEELKEEKQRQRLQAEGDQRLEKADAERERVQEWQQARFKGLLPQNPAEEQPQ